MTIKRGLPSAGSVKRRKKVNQVGGKTKNDGLSYKDLVTGQIITSDRIYEGSLFSRMELYGFTGDSLQSEVELSPRNIVETEVAQYILPDGVIQTKIERAIFTGAYKYANGRIVGRTQRMTSYSVILQDNIFYREVLTTSMSPNAFSVKLLPLSGNIPSPTVQSVDRLRDANLPDINLAIDGWWNNPFAPNLI
jgi:hypothetical protein